MRKAGFWLLSLLAVMTLSISSYGCIAPEPTQPLDEQAQEIYRSLMCPLCPGQTIDQSQSELSTQMRALVREKLEQSESKEEILQFFVERYGEAVLAAPVKSGFSLIVWVVPILGIFTGFIVLWVIIRNWVRGRNKSYAKLTSQIPDDDQDKEYREKLEKDLEDFEDRGFR